MPKVEPFEEYASQYEGWFERNRFVYESELRAIREQLPEKGKGIEIGVGSGRFAAPLGIEMGVEPSRKMRELAQKRGIRTIEGVAERLPFHNSQFEFALMVTTVCFVDDIQDSFQEAYRILKPGGCLIIGFIDRESSLGRLYQQHKKKSVFYKIATFYTVAEILLNLKKVGFKNFSLIQTIFHSLSKIKAIEPIKEGYGEGSFVVIKALK